MTTVDVVTGAGSGIGAAMIRELDGQGRTVLGIGRHRDTLEAAGEGCRGFTPVVADLSEPAGREAVVTAVGGDRVGYVIHNAGRLEPMGDLMTVELDEWRRSFAINVEAPLFLTQALIGRLAPDARVLHISSGAAHRPRRGWGAYCATKATLYMLYRSLAEELADRGVSVGSARPGVVDTPMQELIRAQTADRFPGVERFRALKRDGELVSPAEVAHFLWQLLTQTDADRFRQEEWDIREHGSLFV